MQYIVSAQRSSFMGKYLKKKKFVQNSQLHFDRLTVASNLRENARETDIETAASVFGAPTTKEVIESRIRYEFHFVCLAHALPGRQSGRAYHEINIDHFFDFSFFCPFAFDIYLHVYGCVWRPRQVFHQIKFNRTAKALILLYYY